METTRPCRFFELSGLVRTNSMNVAFYRIYGLLQNRGVSGCGVCPGLTGSVDG